MSVSGLSVYNGPFEEFLLEIERIPVPNDQNRDELELRFKKMLEKDDVAAFIFEPLVQGAAAMYMYPAEPLEALMETLKVLHVLGPLNGGRIGAMSTSGGDLTLLADAMGPGLTMPPLSEKVALRLRTKVHERVVAANPFDYQMFNWDDEDHMAAKFTALLSEDFDVALCLLDYPREDFCDQSTWGGAERGFVRAAQQTGTKGAVLATFSDTISESVAARLIPGSIPMPWPSWPRPKLALPWRHQPG